MANRATFGQKTFHVGDTVRVHYRLIEKEKVAGKAKGEVKEKVRERTQIFEGIVISIKGAGDKKMFIVRKIASSGIGVERIFPLSSPWIKKITIRRKGKVRRAKLYYLRKKMGEQAEKLKEKKETTPSFHEEKK